MRALSRILKFSSLVLVLGASPSLLQSQPTHPRDTAISGSDSTVNEPGVTHIGLGDSYFRLCTRVPRATCSFAGALILGSISYAVSDAITPNPVYSPYSGLGSRSCLENCDSPRKVIVISLSGATLGAVAGWMGGKR